MRIEAEALRHIRITSDAIVGNAMSLKERVVEGDPIATSDLFHSITAGTSYIDGAVSVLELYALRGEEDHERSDP